VGNAFGMLARNGAYPAPDTLPSRYPAPPRLLPQGREALEDAAIIRDPHRLARIVQSQVDVPNGSDVLALTEPTGVRNMLILRNASVTANIFISFGVAASSLSAPLVMEPGRMILLDTVCPQDEVHAIADAAGASLCIGVSSYGA